MKTDHFDVFDQELPPGRWCERCQARRLSDCSVLCFATSNNPANQATDVNRTHS